MKGRIDSWSKSLFSVSPKITDVHCKSIDSPRPSFQPFGLWRKLATSLPWWLIVEAQMLEPQVPKPRHMALRVWSKEHGLRSPSPLMARWELVVLPLRSGSSGCWSERSSCAAGSPVDVHVCWVEKLPAPLRREVVVHCRIWKTRH